MTDLPTNRGKRSVPAPGADASRSDGRSERARLVSEDPSLGELLQELRILQQGSQVLTAFLIILPFNTGFSRLPASAHGVYLATFLCALGSLIFLSAPAAHHRLARPLQDRPAFKTTATRLALVGLGLFSIALVLASYLIVSAVVSAVPAIIVASLVGAVILGVWWVFPWIFLRRREHQV